MKRRRAQPTETSDATDSPFDDWWMSKRDAAKYTGLSKATLDHHSIAIKDLPRVKLPGKVLYKKSDLDRWLQSFAEEHHTFDAERVADAALAQFKKKMLR